MSRHYFGIAIPQKELDPQSAQKFDYINDTLGNQFVTVDQSYFSSYFFKLFLSSYFSVKEISLKDYLESIENNHFAQRWNQKAVAVIEPGHSAIALTLAIEKNEKTWFGPFCESISGQT